MNTWHLDGDLKSSYPKSTIKVCENLFFFPPGDIKNHNVDMEAGWFLSLDLPGI